MDSCGAAACVDGVGEELRIVLLGPPGAGKGTQAGFLRERRGIPHISTGDMLRACIQLGTEAGKAAEKLVNAGELVPNELVRQIVADRLRQDDAATGFILDGYPRNLKQAQELEEILTELEAKVDSVVELTVSEDEVVRRLSGRRTCSGCKTVFHVEFNRPRAAGVCDRCGSELIQRTDDREDIIRDRMRVYREATAPVAGYYRDRGLLLSVEASGDVRQIAGNIHAALNGAG